MEWAIDWEVYNGLSENLMNDSIYGEHLSHKDATYLVLSISQPFFFFHSAFSFHFWELYRDRHRGDQVGWRFATSFAVAWFFPFFLPFLLICTMWDWGLLFFFLFWTGPTDCDSIPFCTGVCLS
jgi:hypothetical protein